MESQITMLEEKIALLEQASGSGLQASGKASGYVSNVNPEVRSLKSEVGAAPEARSLKPEVRAKLAAPTNLNATPFGSGFLRVSWNAVVGAKGYLVQYSSDSAFVNDVHAEMVDAPSASITLSGLKPDTGNHIFQTLFRMGKEYQAHLERFYLTLWIFL
jgi:hypothetical protein